MIFFLFAISRITNTDSQRNLNENKWKLKKLIYQLKLKNVADVSTTSQYLRFTNI